MAKAMFEVECPCCQAVLKVDPDTRAVIAHTVPVKPPPIEDLAAEVAKLKSFFRKVRKPRGRTAKSWGKSSTNCSSGPRKIPTTVRRSAISTWISGRRFGGRQSR
jgi:hypothetical protein